MTLTYHNVLKRYFVEITYNNLTYYEHNMEVLKQILTNYDLYEEEKLALNDAISSFKTLMDMDSNS